MPDTDPKMRHWLSVHQRVRKHIQWTVTLLAFVAAVSVIQGFGHLQSLNESYQFAREFTLQLQEEGPREEAARLFERRRAKAGLCSKEGRIFVRLEDIPEVGWEYERFLSKNHPSGIFEVGGYKLGYASFAVLLLFVPLGLLVLIYLRLRTTAKIAMMLREKAVERSEVQQCLNSVFNERATERLGEHRWFYATVWALVILVLVATPTVFVLAMQTTTVINTKVAIDKLGNITPLGDVGLSERTDTVSPDENVLSLTLVLILANMSLGLLVWRSVVHQLRPKAESEKKTTSDAT